ncbi:MAG: hypothetical protein J6T39_02045, partial [Clostridia bacterium]|nr:hypothetical protein [Clostridia bacterium]
SLAGVIADKIYGVKNVGGVVGQMTAGKLSGAYVRAEEDVEIEKYYKTADEQYVAGKTYYELSDSVYVEVQTIDTEHPENLANYYEKVVYYGRTQLKAKTYVAGLVAAIQDADIEKCFAKVDIVATDETSVAAGLVATMINAKFNYGYVFATVQARTMAMVAASATNYARIYQIYAVVNERTTTALPFVAGDNSGVAVLYCAKQAVVGQSANGNVYADLTDRYVYSSEPLYWDIGESSKYWQIDNTRNNGYPVLVFNGSVLDDTNVKRFEVELKDDYKVVDGIIRLELEKEYRITDLLTFTINGLELNNTSNYRVYISSNVNIGELSSVKKALSDNLKISSIYAKTVVLTFECGGYSINKAFAFTKEVVGLNGEVTVTGNVKRNVVFNYQADNGRIVSANSFDSDMYIAIKDLPDCLAIDGGITQTINEVEYHLFQSSLALKSSESVDVAFELYQLVGDKYIKINNATATLKVTYVGEKASKILADSEYLLITPSSDQTITVYVYKNGTEEPEGVKSELSRNFDGYITIEPISVGTFSGGWKYV